MKVGSSSGRTNQSQGPESNINCHRFILPPLLATPTMQFSLDHKRRSHKQNHCPASNTVGLLFTRLYRSTLLITTPTTTLSLIKTSLKDNFVQLVWQSRGHFHLLCFSITCRLLTSKVYQLMCFSLPLIKCLPGPPSYDYCWALFHCLNCAQWFDYRVLGSSRKLGRAAEY